MRGAGCVVRVQSTMRTTRTALLLLLMLSVATLQTVLCNQSMLPPYESLPSMSRAELSEHDGTDTSKPLLVAIKGYVFDVSESQFVLLVGRLPLLR